MTKEMLKLYIKQQERKIKGLIATIVLLSVVLVVFAGLFFADLDVDINNKEIYDIDQSADGFQGGDNSHLEQNASIEQQNNSIFLICGTVIACVLILTAGVVIYAHYNKSHKNIQN